MKVAQNYSELIGNTPMLRLNRIEHIFKTQAHIIAKIESFNPLGSVKDRLAYALIEYLESLKLIKEDTVIIEPTSGNTGIGLAFICAAKQYKLILVMPDTVSKERIKIQRALGAQVILTEGTQGIKGALEMTKSLLEKNPNYITAKQFENEANSKMHRKTTAIEILNDMDEMIDFLICGVGTGGTITGVGEVLKEKNPDLKVIAVEPKDSPVLSGGKPGPHKIQGIGPGFVPPVLNMKIIDEIVCVSNEDAYALTRLLAKSEGVFAGVSSGAALFAAVKIAQKIENKGKKVVVIFPDTGERYLSTPLYDEIL